MAGVGRIAALFVAGMPIAFFHAPAAVAASQLIEPARLLEAERVLAEAPDPVGSTPDESAVPIGSHASLPGTDATGWMPWVPDNRGLFRASMAGIISDCNQVYGMSVTRRNQLEITSFTCDADGYFVMWDDESTSLCLSNASCTIRESNGRETTFEASVLCFRFLH